jgi:hypothetical protein
VVPHEPEALAPPPAAAVDPPAAAVEAPPADEAGALAEVEDPLDEHAAASPVASSAPAIITHGRLPGNLRLPLFPFIGHYPHSSLDLPPLALRRIG